MPLAEISAAQLAAIKFELAIAIGESLELEPMVRRFLVPLLQAVRGRSCQLVLRCPDGSIERVAYPQRSLVVTYSDPLRRPWMLHVAGQSAGPRQRLDLPDGVLHALAVGDEGWLFIERAAEAVPDVVLDAITVVLARLSKACRACHEYASTRRIVEEKEVAEQALQETNARMAEIFSLSSDGFATFNTAGRLTFCSPRLGELLGHRLRAGQTLQELDHHLQSRCEGGGALAEQVATLTAGQSVQGLLSWTGPPLRVLSYTLRRTPDDARTVLYVREVTREHELDRMKSEFLATAAHELRTPMVSIFGFTELLLTRELSPERQKRLLQTIQRQSSLLVNLVNQLLDLARIEARQARSLALREATLGGLVRGAVDALMIVGDGRQVQLHWHPGSEAWTLQVDTEKFHRALTNVLSNAYKYSPQGGGIHLHTAPAHTADGRPAVAVEVRDHGIGMSEDQLSRVFERFYRADPSGHIPGTGLGMSLVQEILALHGGTVTVSSRLGHGTTVLMTWPLTAMTEAAGAAAVEPSIPQAGAASGSVPRMPASCG